MSSKFKLPLKVISQTGSSQTGTVFFFHGSGDTGSGVCEWVHFLKKNFNFPHLKIVYPTAPQQPYTPMGGDMSNVWFDRSAITKDAPELLESLDTMANQVVGLINEEVKNGIPLNRIIIGGFSMGGALSLHIGYRYLPQLAGVFALSSFINDNSYLYKHLSSNSGMTPPLFQWHGLRDDLVPSEWGKETYQNLSKLGVEGEFHEGKNALHELKKDCLENLHAWILNKLP